MVRKYGKRRNYRRRRYLNKTNIVANRGAKSQARQILSLQRQVKTINRKVNDRTQYSQFQIAYSQEALGHGALPSTAWQPAVFRPIAPSVWTPIFQSNAPGSDLFGNKFRGRSIGFEHMIQLNTNSELIGTEDPVTCTLMCVSLRKEVALQVIQDTGQLNNFTQQNRSYVLSTMGVLQGSGMCMINKGYFKVRYLKRFMLGAKIDFNQTSPTANLTDNNRRIYTKLSYPNLFKSGRGDETWKDITPQQVEPTDHLIWLLFHNAYGDQTISWHCNSVITGRETN